MNRRILPLFILAILLGTFTPVHAAGTSKEFNPMQFFAGHTRSTGTFRDRAGRPTQRVRTETWGRIVQGELRMEQTLDIEGKPRQHRSWEVHRVARDRYEATANDMIGTARGRVTGNTFDWSFILATKPPNPIYNIRMTQHMTLEPGGRALRNDTTFRKLGIVLTTCSERFRKVK